MSELSEMVVKFSGRYREKLKRLAEPLLQTFGINHFYYIHIASTNIAHFIGTKPELIEDYLENDMHKYNPFYQNSTTLTNGIYLYDSVKHQKFQESMNYLETKYNTKHSCVLTKRNQDGVCIYGFSVPRERIECETVLINQIPLLKQYTYYFEDEMSHVLQKMRANSVEMTFSSDLIPLPHMHLEEEQIIDFLQKISRFEDKMFATKFTKREIECIPLLISGKTAREIAKELYRSSRTIEHRLEALKDKLDCRTKSELIQRLQKLRMLYDHDVN